MIPNKLFTIFFFMCVTVKMYGFQKDNFTGKILDTKNTPIENAYVYNTNSKTHTHSNINGEFILKNSHEGNIVQIGLLGFESLEIVLTKKHISNPQNYFLETKLVKLDELILTKELNAMQSISKIDLNVSPVNSSQEILRKVPGLFIGQHAGGGKAEQLFLRGFDIDHGTDLSLSVDGMPVNMVSHAHGQGYSDLHFLIPETIEKINFGKGPYYADKGDFNTAGYVDFKTKRRINNNSLTFELGDFGSLRTLAMINLLEKSKKEDAYIAFEYLAFDGPYESPQNFGRTNIFGKYTTLINNQDRISTTVSHFTSRWNASGQIPERAVKDGTISRFGAIDDTEGGETSRTNFNIEYTTTLENNSILKTNAFYTNYKFELYSNFTFFLEDAINGDQIKQFENRDIFGINAEMISTKLIGNTDMKIKKGFGIRKDNVNNIELSHTKNKFQIIDSLQLGNVSQTNMYAFLNTDFKMGKLTISPSLRLDYFKFLYENKLSSVNNKALAISKTIINPKINFLYNHNDQLQWFLKSGIGFHSNDTRVILQQNTKNILPRAYGIDFGNIMKPFSKFVFNTALWYLYSEEELVYVGDAGIVEPTGSSQRYGVDLGFRYELTDWLYIDSDATIVKARSLEAIKGEDYIPLAPQFTLTGGAAFKFDNFSGGFRYRFIDDRAANEDYSITAKGYFVTDLNLNYKLKNINIGITLENLFDTAWKETQFATESRLQNELNSAEEIHFTPGTPFFAKASITYKF